MTKKEFLCQYLNVQTEIAAKLDQITSLRELSTRITRSLSPNKVKSSSDNQLEATVSKIVDMEKEIGASIDKLDQARRQVESAIDSMPNPVQRNVLRLRYLNGKNLEQVAEEMNYTYRNVCYLHGKALDQMTIS